MSIIDSELLFGTEQDVSGAAAVPSTNVVHFPQVKTVKGTSVNQRLVNGKSTFNVIVDGAGLKSDAGNVTCTIGLYHHTAEANVTTSGTLIYETKIVVDAAGANYPAGTKICSFPLPVESIKPYVQANFADSTNAIATGKLTWWIGHPHQETE